MDAKHTPGPWHVAEHNHAIVVCAESVKKSQYGASRYAAIGGFDRNDPEQLAEALANASLIAAAPELLEALQMFIRDMHAEGMIENVPIGLYPAAKAAEAAIAKATGSKK